MLAAVPELVLLGFFGWNAERVETRSVGDEAKRFAALLGAHQEQILGTTFDLVRTLAQTDEVASGDADRCRNYLQRVLRLQTVYTGFLRITPSGEADCASRRLEAPLDLRGSPIFSTDWRDREFMVVPLTKGPISERPILVVVRRLLSSDGRVTGYIQAAVGLDWLSESVGSMNLPAGSQLIVLDGGGRVILHYPEASEWIGRTIADQPLGRALAEGRGPRLTGLDGRERIYGVHEQSTAGHDFTFAIGLPVDTALSVAGELRGYSLLAIAAALVGIVVAGWFAANKLVLNWTDRILTTARTVMGGHYKARVGGPYPNGELGDLAQTFDRMLDEVARREGELQQREEWFRSVVQHSTDMIAIIDADGRYRYVSPAVERVLGYDPEDLADVSAASLVHPDEQARFGEIIRYVGAQPNRVAALEHRLRHADGHYVEIESIGINLLGNSGVAGIVVNSRDVTRRRRIEEMLRLVTTATDQSTDGVLITTSELGERGPEIVYVNPALGRLAGREEHELIGQTPEIFDLEGVAQTMLEHMRQSGELDSPARFELRGLCRAGRQAPLELVATPLRDENGRPTHFVIIVRDITDARNAEADRQRLEATLRQALKMEAVGTLAGGIAHDFNNVLLPMMMLTQLTINRLPAGGRERSDLERVLAAQKRAKSLVGQILAFSRGSSGEYVDVDLMDICRETMTLLRASLPSTVTLVDRLEPTPTVRADSTQIQQVVMNLCTNAAQAMPSAKGTITVRLGTVDWPGGGDLPRGRYCRLEVADDGSGIPPEIVERIFDPFFTTKEVGVGTGLGLSVVHGIVSAHKGAISVHSEVGQGTVFTILLPVKQGQLESAAE